MSMEPWKPYYVGGRWPYWQCATPTGPYNFQAKDEAAAIAWAEKVRKQSSESEDA